MLTSTVRNALIAAFWISSFVLVIVILSCLHASWEITPLAAQARGEAPRPGGHGAGLFY
jgi:hypothetical protein